eukprot:m51a1_g3299 putative t-complex protein 1 subunit (547) ;mRNA; r:307135-309035
MSHMLQPTILLLREGTDQSQGRPQIISNINACQAIVDAAKTTLGPRGMDKLIVKGRQQTVTNDGATVLKLLDVVHPAAKVLVDIARSQDSEVGDGTTSVVLFAGELLSEAKRFIEDGLVPQVIIRGFRKACNLARAKVTEMAVSFGAGEGEAQRAELRRFLETCAATAMQSKLIAAQRGHFSKLVVDAVLHLDRDLEEESIGVKKEPGGALQDSFSVEGVAFKKTFSYAGFEQQPKSIDHPKIVCLNLELELRAERDNAEIRLEDPAAYQSIVDAEWSIIYGKLAAIVESGANVVLSKLAIGDLATQYFADRGIFCAGRVADDDLRRVCKATGAQVQTTVTGLKPDMLGTCARFEERQVGKERYNLFTGCTSAKSMTIVLRGAGEHFIDEAERSLHDAICIARRAFRHRSVVAGGGAVEMALSAYLHDEALRVEGKEQIVLSGYARALEAIPRQLSDNAGFDSTIILNQLRQRHHAAGGQNIGVDIMNEGVCDTMEAGVWEPALVKLNALAAATEAACVILSIDETLKNKPSQSADSTQPAPMPRR